MIPGSHQIADPEKYNTMNPYALSITWPRLLLMLALVTFLPGCAQEAAKPIPLIIDADTANEVDDLFAIVRAIDAPAFSLLGVSSAQFHTSPLASGNSVQESQQVNEKIMALLRKRQIPLPLGSNTPLRSVEVPQNSPASDFIVAQARRHSPENPLHVVVLGPCTNVASAILQDPAIIPHLKVHYLGFWHDPATNDYNKEEFNTGNDPLAVEVLLNQRDLDLSVMTATTSQHLIFEKTVASSHLKGKGGIADYLLARWETYERWWTREDPEKAKWVMWDVALIEALAHPEWTEVHPFLAPPGNTPRTLNIHTRIEVGKMKADFWKHLEKLIHGE